MLLQVKLQRSGEPLQIPYPEGWEGERSGTAEDTTLLVNQLPRWVTPDEELLINEYIGKLPYRQSLERTGAVQIDADDPLLNATHEELDTAEAAAQLPNTRTLIGGGTRSIQERVLILRERGYRGGAHRAIGGDAVAAP
ncbi:MAG: hypothetical protein SNJ57_10040 [Cyanobacteriota bacterium]